MKIAKEESMRTNQPRAALLLQADIGSQATSEQQQEVCRRYCQEQGYQLSEQHIYQSEAGSFYGSDPQFVQLRFLVVQGQLDVLVIPWSECLGSSPLWISIPTARCIDAFYKYDVRIESVMQRNGTHDIAQQMYKDALHFVKQMDRRQTEYPSPDKRHEQKDERP